MTSFTSRFYPILIACSQTIWALDGSNAVFVTVPTGESTGWKTFEIISASDVVNGLNFDGTWDGIGTYRSSAGTITVFINHETGNNSTFSQVELNVTNLKDWITAGTANNGNSNQELPSGPVVESVDLGWNSVDGDASDPINRPCSGNVWLADTFGPERGFAHDLYLLGEESFNSNGHIWIMDLESRTLYEAVDLGGGSWENATLIDSGRMDTVALILSEDLGSNLTEGTAPLRLYVGLKNSEGNFLERNGLSGGTIYYWDPDGISTRGTMSGIFSTGNGTVISGEWTTDSTGAALFSKSEDVHINMNKDSSGYGLEVALAAQGQAVFKIDFSEVGFVAGALGANRTSAVTVLYEAGSEDSSLSNDFSGMDNLVWSADGKIYVNEDDGEGDVWLIDPASLEASYDSGDYTPDTTQVYEILDADYVTESTGIIDISEHLDYQPGSIFLTNGQSATTSENQLALAVSPSAKLLSAAYTDWIVEFSVSDASKSADPDLDGQTNAIEFALNTSPNEANTSPPLQLLEQASYWEAWVTPGRSLNLVRYEIEYTEDLAQGFNQSILLTAGMIDGSGNAAIALPQADQLFIRLNVVIP
jgi:hypothetical protein